MATREFLDYVLPWLVDSPDDIEIAEIEGEGDAITYEISVHPDDMGKVIGRRGRIIRSLRAVSRAAEGSGRQVSVEVVD